MTWITEPLLAFDVESTGVDVETARIVTATVVRINGPQISERQWLINPGVPIPAEATAIHKVTDEIAQRDGADPLIALRQIALAVARAFLDGVPVIAYNASYDLTVLDRELRRHELAPLDEWTNGPLRPVIDPLVIDRAVDKYRKGKRTLTASCEHYRVRLDEAHNATADAVAAARLAWRLATVFPQKVGNVSPSDLHDQQVVWQAEWAAHFEDYLRRKGETDARIDGSWPLRAINQEAIA